MPPLTPHRSASTETLTDRWQPLLRLVPEWSPTARRTVIVVPHPDDEILATGGLLMDHVRRGAALRIIAVTDGEAAYEVAGLASRRRHEQEAALTKVGVDADTVTRLGLPDGSVEKHHEQLVDEIAQASADADLLVAPWIFDHHCDHEACGRAAIEAAALVGVELVFSLFWTWHHTSPTELSRHNVRALHLGADDLSRRWDAFAEHKSQHGTVVSDEPILAPEDVESLGWAAEYYVCDAA